MIIIAHLGGYESHFWTSAGCICAQVINLTSCADLYFCVFVTVLP